MAFEQITVSKTGNYYLTANQKQVVITAAPNVTAFIVPPIGFGIDGNSSLRLNQGQSVSLQLSGKMWLSGQTVPFHNSLQGLQGGDGTNFYHLGAAAYLTQPVFYYSTWDIIQGLNTITYSNGNDIYAGKIIWDYKFWAASGKDSLSFVINRLSDPALNSFTFNSPTAYPNVGIYLLLQGTTLPPTQSQPTPPSP